MKNLTQMTIVEEINAPSCTFLHQRTPMSLQITLYHFIIGFKITKNLLCSIFHFFSITRMHVALALVLCALAHSCACSSTHHQSELECCTQGHAHAQTNQGLCSAPDSLIAQFKGFRRLFCRGELRVQVI